MHTIRVKREFFVEDDVTKKAGGAIPLLTCDHDPSFGNGDGVRFKCEEGALKCSHVVAFDKRICDVSEDKRAAIKEHASFVYMDVGCWADNADGNQTKCRNFGLVCGPHVYLCRYTEEKKVPNSRVPSVQQFFREMLNQDCGIEVISYAYSGDETRRPKEDSQLYLFLGDLHLPPRNWDVKFHFFQDYIRLGNLSDPDIFKQAGKDLTIFLKALAHLSGGIKKLLHFIQTGDMLELWLGESYLFKPGTEKPEWINAEAPAQAARWARDALGSNLSVLFAFQGLEEAGLAETKFVWGNHDGYLQDRRVTEEAGLPARYASYEGLNGEIFCEHGHRFDRHNFDNRENGNSIWDGNFVTNIGAYYIPPGRTLEKFARTYWPGNWGYLSEREAYLLGASLVNLNLRVDQKKSPFTIYVMAHSHDCKMSRCIIEPKISEEIRL